MSIGRSLGLLALVVLVSACATKKVPEPPPARIEPPPVVEDLSRDTTVMPGERVGPIKLDMTLQQLLTAMGEPVGSTASRMPAGRPALLYRYPNPQAGEGAILVLVREYDQTIYSVQLDAVETYQTREGVRVGSSEALVRASFGKPQATQGTADGGKNYCYLNGLAVQLDVQGKVRSLTVFPGSDLRKVCRTPPAQQ